jgi:hypothetical protein
MDQSSVLEAICKSGVALNFFSGIAIFDLKGFGPFGRAETSFPGQELSHWWFPYFQLY